MAEKKKALCPMCHTPTVTPQYSPDVMTPNGPLSNIRLSPINGMLYVPVRCAKCGINFELKTSPDALEPHLDD